MGEAIRSVTGAAANGIYQTTTAMDFYPAAGACDDWMYDKIVQSPDPKAAIDKGLVYTIELCPSESADDVCGQAMGPRVFGAVAAYKYAACGNHGYTTKPLQ
jgi:hypothetical protein